MNVKIQGGGKNCGVYANDGSAAGLIAYLQHEDQERLKNGQEIIPFFTGQGIDVTPEEAIMKLDRNHKKLHARDAKFYHLDINPSQDELRAMGDTEDEIIAGCKRYAIAMTQAYAENFHKDVVISTDEAGNPVTRPLSGEDIMIFWKIHTTRDDKEGLQVHLQSGVSRKDIHNKIQLSPVTNHKGTTSGAVKGGFERTAYYRTAEEVFDKMFGYKRQQEETFDFYLAQKEERKAEEKRQSMLNEYEDEHGDVDVYDAQMAAAVAKRNKRRRDEFWNEYHTHYSPLYNSLKETCDKSFRLYQTAKERYNLGSAAITEKYDELRAVYKRMNELEGDIEKASKAKGLSTAISALVFFVNPVAGLVLGLVSRMVAQADKEASIDARRELRREAAEIRDSIGVLKVQQVALRQDKQDKLKIYAEDKEAKVVLQNEINDLKAALDKPLEQKTVKVAAPVAHNAVTPPTQTATSAVPAATPQDVKWQEYRTVLQKYYPKGSAFEFAIGEDDRSCCVTITIPGKKQGKVHIKNNILRFNTGNYIDFDKKEYIKVTPNTQLNIKGKSQQTVTPESATPVAGKTVTPPAQASTPATAKHVSESTSPAARKTLTSPVKVATPAPSKEKTKSERIAGLIEEANKKGSLQTIINYINETHFDDSAEYHVVPGTMEPIPEGIRLNLSEDGYTSDGFNIYPLQLNIAPIHGKSYIDFKFDEKGHLIAHIELDPTNSYTKGRQGDFELDTGKRKLSPREYRGTPEEYAQKQAKQSVLPKKKSKKFGKGI